VLGESLGLRCARIDLAGCTAKSELLARIGAALELGRRLVLRDTEERPWLPDSRAVFRYARSRWRNLEHEELWVLALDAQHRLRASVRAAQGGLHGMQLAVRDPLRLALREAASAFVLVHNHPSGDPSPSADDLEITRGGVSSSSATRAATSRTPLS
jgi:DNA repair protein RadC